MNTHTAHTEPIAEDFDELSRGYHAAWLCTALTSRYYSIRHAANDPFYEAPMPNEPPEVVSAILDACCNDCLLRALLYKGWNACDELLRCDSADDVRSVIGAWIQPPQP